jgi:hypothetical protein
VCVFVWLLVGWLLLFCLFVCYFHILILKFDYLILSLSVVMSRCVCMCVCVYVCVYVCVCVCVGVRACVCVVFLIILCVDLYMTMMVVY